MGTFLIDMIYVPDALGFTFFEEPGAVSSGASDPVRSSAVAPLVVTFFTSAQPRRETHKAYLDMVGDGYVLRAGSLFSASVTECLPANVGKLRDQLLSENALTLQDGCLRLTKKIGFTSPSPASALVKGHSSTGHGDWSRTTERTASNLATCCVSAETRRA